MKQDKRVGIESKAPGPTPLFNLPICKESDAFLIVQRIHRQRFGLCKNESRLLWIMMNGVSGENVPTYARIQSKMAKRSIGGVNHKVAHISERFVIALGRRALGLALRRARSDTSAAVPPYLYADTPYHLSRY